MMYKTSAYILRTTTTEGELILKNTLTQKMLKVSKTKTPLINSILLNPNMVAENDENFKALYKKGFIVNEYVDETKIVDYIFNDAIFGSNILELTIIPTNACNFNCVYCYQSSAPGFMTQEAANSIIRFIETNIFKYSGLLISWFGGEPLLSKKTIIEFMTQIRKICLKHKKPFYSNITTNGYELDENTFNELLINHLRYYQITIDGPKEIHNSQRPHKVNGDSFERIVSNLLTIKEKFNKWNYRIAIRVNVSSKFRMQIGEFVDWLYENFGNDPHFVIVWEFVRDWGGEKIKQHQELIFDHKESNSWLDVLSQKGFAINMGLEQNDLTVALCTASKKHGYVINYDGKVYKCAMVVENDDFKDINNIGCINDGILDLDIGKMVKWLGRNSIDDKCISCGHYPECMGISCPLGTQILNQPNRCSELFTDDYEYLLRNRDVIKNIDYIS